MRPALVLLFCLIPLACREAVRPEPGAVAVRGRRLIAEYDCNVCHIVPGVAGPQGTIGPSLAGVASRPLISHGTVENTPENLARFVQDPGSLNPRSSMPRMSVDPRDAREIAAFLQTLR